MSRTAAAHRVVLPKFVAASKFIPCALLVVGYRDGRMRTQQPPVALKTFLGEPGLYAGDIITYAGNIKNASGRRFNDEPLVASQRAAQKIALDPSAVKKTRERGMRTGAGRDAFIYLSCSKLMAGRALFSAALTQIITRIAAMLPPFLNRHPIKAEVGCISDIFSPPVAKHLADLRRKHLKVIETLKSGIRTSSTIQTLRNAPTASGTGARLTRRPVCGARPVAVASQIPRKSSERTARRRAKAALPAAVPSKRPRISTERAARRLSNVAPPAAVAPQGPRTSILRIIRTCQRT